MNVAAEPTGQRDPQLDQWVAELCQRSPAALSRLYEATAARLYAVALRVTGCAADAEEVVVDVYQHVWTHATDFDPARGGALTWMCMLTWSRAVDRRRRLRPQADGLHPDADHDTYTPAAMEADPLAAFVDGARVRTALEALRPEQRDLILMAFYEGASHSEIAARTGWPLGTVKSHIRRGVDALRQALGDEDVD